MEFNSNTNNERENVHQVENENNNNPMIRSKTRLMDRIENNATQYFTFWNSFCMNYYVFNKPKRNFVSLISKVVDNKLSVEYILELSNNFQLLKKSVLNQEQYYKFDYLPNLSFEEQLKEFGIKLKL